MTFVDDEFETTDQRAAFQAGLAGVRAGRLSDEGLNGLSHLTPEQEGEFEEAWRELSVKQRLTLLEALSLEELESLRLDFNAIYHLAMLDEDDAVRRAAIQAVVEDDSSWLLSRLLHLVVSDPEPEVRAAAALGLGSFAQRAELGDIEAESRLSIRDRDTLIETIHRPGERVDVQAAALESLGFISGDLVSNEIEAAFREPETRLQALRAMGHSADPQWLGKIFDLFNDPDDTLRATAAQAAGEIGDESAIAGLTELIDDSELPVRIAAIGALGEIGGDEARELLIYALEDKREVIREAAAAAIETLDFFDDPMTL
jgi:HEAT repeat protein